MKRFLLLCFSVLSVITAFGCVGGPRAERLFFYRDEGVTATVDMECNGSSSSFRLDITKEGDVSVSFTAPAELCGFVISVLNDGTATVTVDGLTASAPNTLALIPNICSRLFSLSESDVVGIETKSDGGETLTLLDADGITVILNRDGIPVGAEGVCEGVIFRAVITDFSILSETNELN